ncbi:hypothetical protein ACFV30_02375 [Streptomyces sp. NPDC059752]|uniref:hypothetical protein n=1 Tax=unclassified Streptomyces TaxID=2593676 RepID=UPI00365667B5
MSEARTAAERRLYDAVARAAFRADPVLAPALAELLVVPKGRRASELERLRTPPAVLRQLEAHAVEEAVPRAAVAGAVATVEALVPRWGARTSRRPLRAMVRAVACPRHIECGELS